MLKEFSLNLSRGKRRQTSAAASLIAIVRVVQLEVVQLEGRIVPTFTFDVSIVGRGAAGNEVGVNLPNFDPLQQSASTLNFATAANFGTFRINGGSSVNKGFWTDPAPYAGAGDAGNAGTLFERLRAATANQVAQAILTASYGNVTYHDNLAMLAYFNGNVNNNTVIGWGMRFDGKTWTPYNFKTVAYWANLRGQTQISGNPDGLNHLRIGHPAPFGIKYLEIGNESYGPWEQDGHGIGAVRGAQQSPATYADHFAAVAAGAKLIDPNVKLGVPVGSVYGFNNWTDNVLRELSSRGVKPDFLADDLYLQASGTEDDYKLLHLPLDTNSEYSWTTRMSGYRTLLVKNYGSAASSVEVHVTEFNTVYQTNGLQASTQSTSLVGALSIAENMADALSSGFQSFSVWALRDGYYAPNNKTTVYVTPGTPSRGDLGLVGPDNDASNKNVPYATFYAVQLVGSLITPGATFVGASSDDPNIRTYAVRQANGDLKLLLINISQTASQSNVRTPNFRAYANAYISQYGINEDNHRPTTAGATNGVSMSNTTLSIQNGEFSYFVPGYSMTVVTLKAASAPPPTTPTGVVTVGQPSRVQITWTAVTDATAYEVWRGPNTSASSAVRIADNVIATSYLDSTLTPGQTAFYFIRAKNAAGASALSTPVAGSISIPTPPQNAGTVSFSLRENFNTGFTIDVNVTNTSASRWTSWVVVFTAPFEISSANIWNASISSKSKTGNTYIYTIKAASWNASVAPGQTAQFGFFGSPGFFQGYPTNVSVIGTGG